VQASSAVVQEDDAEYAVELMRAAYALYDFGTKHNGTASVWSPEVKKTYGTAGFNGQYMLWAASMLAWAHRCASAALPLCKAYQARSWLAVAEEEWQYQVVRTLCSDPSVL
jgi:hypothetical protein